jgi:hypothetical protein
MTPCSLVDCTIALAKLNSYWKFPVVTVSQLETPVYFSIPRSSDCSCSTPAIRCYVYTLSGGAEEVAAHSRRSTDFALTSVGTENEWENHFVRHLALNAAWENKLWYCSGQLYVTLSGTSCAECVWRPPSYNILSTLPIVVTARCRMHHCGTQVYQHVWLQLRLLILITSKFSIWNMILVRIIFWN